MFILCLGEITMEHLKIAGIWMIFCLLSACNKGEIAVDQGPHDLSFHQLSSVWDESIPLGNGMLGALVWQNGEKLRFSLDRADLWDLRPVPDFSKPEWRFKWVFEQWKNNQHAVVRKAFYAPYIDLPAPTKIVAGALEFDLSGLGEVESVRLNLRNAICEIRWKSGTRLLAFVHGSKPCGWYRFEDLPEDIHPEIVAPPYEEGMDGTYDKKSHSWHTPGSLGYSQGDIVESGNNLTYIQEGWGGFRYQMYIEWRDKKGIQEGCWSISSQVPGREKQTDAAENVKAEIGKGFTASLESHKKWWQDFWACSSISIPDAVLEKQWYLEMYKFGSVARKDAPPISLQAVWTADNGRLPPWKGDYHHDLNTQLSYWPAYSSNHSDLGEGFTDWLYGARDTFKSYTKQYFETNGLNVPGVSTLTGHPMGGSPQWVFGPTVSAWLAHQFYQHWRYTLDSIFLEQKAYPWIREVAIFLDEFSVRRHDGKRKLPLSSSPEINPEDIIPGSPRAWFTETTNFDLALIRWTFEKAAELAQVLSLNDEAARWARILSEWPEYAIDPETGLMVAPGFPYNRSHRHFSHLAAIYPLGIIDRSRGETEKTVIANSLAHLESTGSSRWCGYSFSWLGNLFARASDGEKAAEALKIFATCFCLPNSFHANGDQSGTGKSTFTYRPFTLEGNFAFAAGIQEMLIQSHTGIIHIFPAIPAGWKDASFSNLRAEGAFLVSAQRKNGSVTSLSIRSEKGGRVLISNPFETSARIESNIMFHCDDGVIIIDMHPGERATLTIKNQ